LLRGGSEGACLDLSGGEGAGAVLAWVRDSTPFLLAESFTALLEGFAEDLEGGGYAYHEEFGGLVPTDEAEEGGGGCARRWVRWWWGCCCLASRGVAPGRRSRTRGRRWRTESSSCASTTRRRAR